jgi:hypothetical protein
MTAICQRGKGAIEDKTRYQKTDQKRTFTARSYLIRRRVAGEGLEPPTSVLFFSDQSPDDRRLNVFHSRFYTNPLARVLPARSEMVTTLIAQMSDLLAPISKSTTRT